MDVVNVTTNRQLVKFRVFCKHALISVLTPVTDRLKDICGYQINTELSVEYTQNHE